MESIIYTPRIITLIEEIFEIKRMHEEKKLVKLVQVVEILRQQQTEKHIRRIEFLLEQIRVQREILAQWPLTQALFRQQLQQPIVNLAIEQLLRKQEFFLEEPTLMTLPVIRRREVLEQIICQELFQLLKLHKEFVLPVLPWTTFEQEQLPMLWTTKSLVLPTQRRWVEKLLEQIELVVPRIYKQEVVVRSVVPLLKELVYNTMVPRWWFFEQAKLYNQVLPKQYYGEEKLVEKELLYNTMLPRCYGEEEIVYKPRHFLGEEEIYNTMVPRCFSEEEKLLKEKLVYKQLPFLGGEEKIVKKEIVVPTTPYTTMPVEKLEKELIYKQVPRHYFEEEKLEKELCYPLTKMQLGLGQQLPCFGEEKIVKKEIVVPTTPYLYNQVPRHFLGQEEKLVEKVFPTLPYTTMPLEKELIYNTMIPRCFGEEEKIVKKEEIVYKPRHFLGEEEKIVVEKKKLINEPFTTLYKPNKHFFGLEGEEKLVEKKEYLMPRSYTTTFVPRHFEEKLVEKKELIQPTIMGTLGLEQPIFRHYPEGEMIQPRWF